MTKPNEAFLSQAEACELVGVSRTTFRAWGIEPVRKVGRSLVYRKSDVLRVSAEKRATSSQHRRGDTTTWPVFDRQSLTAEMMIDVSCATAYGNALLQAEYCRSIGRNGLDVDFKLFEIAFAPQAVLESRGLPPKLPACYVQSVIELVNAFRLGNPLPHHYETLPATTNLVRILGDSKPPPFVKSDTHEQTDLL